MIISITSEGGVRLLPEEVPDGLAVELLSLPDAPSQLSRDRHGYAELDSMPSSVRSEIKPFFGHTYPSGYTSDLYRITPEWLTFSEGRTLENYSSCVWSFHFKSARHDLPWMPGCLRIYASTPTDHLHRRIPTAKYTWYAILQCKHAPMVLETFPSVTMIIPPLLSVEAVTAQFDWHALSE